MRNARTNIEKSFRKGILILCMITIALMTITFNKGNNSNVSGLLVGLPIFIAGILGIIGSIHAIKGLKEKKNLKFDFALLINFGVVLIFLGLLLANIMDTAKLFK